MTNIKVLAGFLDSKTGQLRDKKTLARLDASAKDDSASVRGSSNKAEKTLSNALGLVRSRTYEQINTAVTNTRSALDDVKAAKQLTKRETETLKNLEVALKDGNTADTEKYQAEYTKLQEERKQLAAEIDSNNQSRNAQSIRVGNQEVLKVTAAKVDFADALPEVDLNDRSQVKNLRQDIVKAEREQLGATQAQLKGSLNDLKALTKSVDAGLSQLITNDTQAQASFLRDFESAQTLTDQTSQALVKVGGQAVLYNSLSAQSASLLE